MPSPPNFRSPQMLLALAAALALVLRLVYWGQVAGTPFDEWHLWDQTDMATYIEQGRRIAAGDVLAVEPYHPYHAWQSAAGTAEDWLRWYGPHGFHQAPLYSYVMAALSQGTDAYLGVIRVVQVLCGVGTCVLLGLLARRLAGDAAGVATAFLTALYGPLYYLELQYLREGPALCVTALLLSLVVRHVAPDASGLGAARRSWRPFLVGAGLGAFAMFHEFAPVVAAAAVLVLGVHAWRRSPRAAAATCALLLGGALVGFAPLLLRNLAVGAPMFQASSRPHVTLALSNRPGAPEGGVVFAAPGPELKPMLDAAGNSTLGVARELWRSYDGDVGRMLGNWLLRLRAVFTSAELPDNTSFGFHRAHVGVLATSPTFGLVFPLGAAAILWLLAGAVVARRRRAATARSNGPAAPTPVWLGARTAHLAVLAHLPLLVAATTLVNSVARYRLLFVPIFLLYAGVFVGLAARHWRLRNLGTLVGMAALAIVAALVQDAVGGRWADLDARHSDRSVVAAKYSQRGDEATALRFYQEAAAMAPARADVRVQYASSLARLGQLPAALAEFRAVARLAPNDPQVRQAIRALEQQLGNQGRLPAGR